MPPHLHPRSAATSTLFAGTLLASFIVVGIPHVFPCPRPRRSYADSQNMATEEEGEASTRVKQTGAHAMQEGATLVGKNGRGASVAASVAINDEAALFRQLQHEAAVLDKQAHECPMPKPTGWLGQILGFDKDSSNKNGTAP
ncbi:hypothetical protein DV737_g970, partial [Chaetothyriales sp. CBS 132003]